MKPNTHILPDDRKDIPAMSLQAALMRLGAAWLIVLMVALPTKLAAEEPTEWLNGRLALAWTFLEVSYQTVIQDFFEFELKDGKVTIRTYRFGGESRVIGMGSLSKADDGKWVLKFKIGEKDFISDAFIKDSASGTIEFETETAPGRKDGTWVLTALPNPKPAPKE